ncbi:unnamed protein product [Mytilus edulis]|uniref:Uncharacterized protein n=1 Tax=Mytilus edulis TaxID=6550 RepID=A0A8S3TJY4_MYTED|nr:unnamed protein product [Mytilus edulis]
MNDSPLLLSPTRSIAHKVPTPSYVYWFHPNKGLIAKPNVMRQHTIIDMILVVVDSSTADMATNNNIINIINHELLAAQTPTWFHFVSGVVLLTTTSVSLHIKRRNKEPVQKELTNEQELAITVTMIIEANSFQTSAEFISLFEIEEECMPLRIEQTAVISVNLKGETTRCILLTSERNNPDCHPMKRKSQ